MFSLRFSVILIIILLIPFLLRNKFGNQYEIYPAIMLPSGAIKTATRTEHLEISYFALFAQNEHQEWVKVNTLNLLYPIPIIYHSHILKREFGLKDKTLAELENRKIAKMMSQLKILKNRNFSEREKINTLIWLKNRLKSIGYMGSHFKIVEIVEVHNTKTNVLINEFYHNEKFYKLP